MLVFDKGWPLSTHIHFLIRIINCGVTISSGNTWNLPGSNRATGEISYDEHSQRLEFQSYWTEIRIWCPDCRFKNELMEWRTSCMFENLPHCSLLEWPRFFLVWASASRDVSSDFGRADQFSTLWTNWHCSPVVVLDFQRNKDLLDKKDETVASWNG